MSSTIVGTAHKGTSGRHVVAFTMIAFAVLLVTFSTYAASQQVAGTLTMQSEEGDWVGKGENYSFGPADGTWTANTYFYDDGSGPHTVSIFFMSDSNWFGLDFSTAQLGQPLAVGTYTDAQRASFADPGHPGLDVGGNGSGCNTVEGQFSIVTIEWVGNTVTNFAADFEQHCSGAEPALYGSVTFTAVADGDGGDGGGGGDGGDGGGSPEPTPPPPPPDVRLVMTEGRLFEIGNSRSMTMPVHVTTREGWEDEVRLTANVPDGIDVAFNPAVMPAPGAGETSMTISVDPMTLPVRHAIPIVIRSNGRVFEDTIFVDVICDPPIILDQDGFQPVSREVAAGEVVTLEVNPTGGTEPYQFQWYEGSSYSTRLPVAGATDRTFTTPPIVQTSWYWVRVYNACGSRDSWIVTLTPQSAEGSSKQPGRRRSISRPGGD